MSKFDQKVQKEVSQMANHKLSCAMLYRWFKCKLKPPKKVHSTYYLLMEKWSHVDLKESSLGT